VANGSDQRIVGPKIRLECTRLTKMQRAGAADDVNILTTRARRERAPRSSDARDI
jgi:hypothetical protein